MAEGHPVHLWEESGLSFEGIATDGHSVHLWEDSGLARDRRMSLVQSPEYTPTLPM